MKNTKALLGLILSSVGAILIVTTGDVEAATISAKAWNLGVSGGTFTVVYNTITLLK